MRIGTWTSIAARLGLGTLLLTACDTEKDPDGKMLAGPGETEGATETEGPAETEGASETEGPGTTVGDTEPGGSAEGQTPEENACSEQGAARGCTTPEGEDGTQYCDFDGTGAMTWHECLTVLTCTPGESRNCGFCDGETGGSEGGSEDGGLCDWNETCYLYDGVPDWDSSHHVDAGCNTPLVLSFDGAPAELVPARAATFDLDGVGGCITTDWPAASTPWLALDVDGNGTIDSGRELFGSGTLLRSGKRAQHGFMALAELDDDGNGRIDMGDPAFSRLVLWSDHDGDRRSTFAEAQPVSQHQILSIELGYRIDRQCDARGNCGVERATFHFVDEHGAVRQGEVVDLHLACQ